MHGWMHSSNKYHLGEILRSKRINVAIEVGSWLGLSASYIAINMSEGAKLYCVDTWNGSIEHYHNQEWLKLLPTLYEQFLSNIIHLNLVDKIYPVRLSSIDASKQLNIKADLIYIDAAHDEESVYNDIIAWSLRLAENGIICGDDYDKSDTMVNPEIQTSCSIVIYTSK